MPYGAMGGYGVGGYGGGAGAGCGGGGMGIRWIYALLILIVIVLQFGRKEKCDVRRVNTCCGDEMAADRDDEIAVAAVSPGFGGLFSSNNQAIDNSVLFIIVVFLLILCAGCFGGGSGATGFGGGMGFGGYGY